MLTGTTFLPLKGIAKQVSYLTSDLIVNVMLMFEK